MQPGIRFGAPWGTALKVMTGFSVAILVGIPLIGLFANPGDGMTQAIWILAMIGMPLAILFGAAFFVIRGYVLTQDALWVERLGWNSKVDLTDLVSVEADPHAMARSIRTFGNGGLFCFAGAFWNKKLGHYRAFATDLDRSVILTFANRTVVITPDQPHEFVRQLTRLKNT